MIQPDEIIRSRRKTLAITVDAFGRLIVRAPLRCSEKRIISFLEEKELRVSTRGQRGTPRTRIIDLRQRLLLYGKGRFYTQTTNGRLCEL